MHKNEFATELVASYESGYKHGMEDERENILLLLKQCKTIKDVEALILTIGEMK
jgi:hypothetical protein